MTFLKRLFGGGGPATAGPPTDDPDATEDEAAHDRELLRAEAVRLDNDLIQRQIRFADRAWTPPPQGGSRRADDPEAPEDA